MPAHSKAPNKVAKIAKVPKNKLCIGVSKDGSKCRMHTKANSPYCFHHMQQSQNKSQIISSIKSGARHKADPMFSQYG